MIFYGFQKKDMEFIKSSVTEQLSRFEFFIQLFPAALGRSSASKAFDNRFIVEKGTLVNYREMAQLKLYLTILNLKNLTSRRQFFELKVNFTPKPKCVR
jgi:hypothetical protein